MFVFYIQLNINQYMLAFMNICHFNDLNFTLPLYNCHFVSLLYYCYPTIR